MSEPAGVRRLWIPIPAVILGLVAWFLPVTFYRDGIDPQMFNLGCVTFVFLCTLITLGWLFLGSGLTKGLRYGLTALAVLLPVALVRGIEFDGIMRPKPVWRWSRTSSQVVAESRGSQTKAASQPLGEPTPEDFPEYRNVRRDGVLTGLSLGRDWKANPPKELWRQPAGEGYAGFSVIGNSAVTMEQRDDDEAVVCYDGDTGRERWDYRYRAAFREPVGGNGPRSNPTIAGGDVYTFGATGVLLRLNGTTGGLRWRYDAVPEGGNIEWAMAGSPLVFDDKVVVSPGGNAGMGRAVVAVHRDTGKVIWQSGERKAGYSSPMLATLCGVRQILVFDAIAVAGFDPATGQELWNFPFEHPGNPGINVAQPMLLGDDRLFVAAGYSKGGAAIQLTKTDAGFEAKELWRTPYMKNKFSTSVLKDGFIYGLDDVFLSCIDAKTGRRKWQGDRYYFGQLLLAGDLLVVQSENGKLALVEASPTAFKEVAALQVLPRDEKNWNHLTVARGRAYLRNHKEMTCYDLPK